jgi:hypothetical protein
MSVRTASLSKLSSKNTNIRNVPGLWADFSISPAVNGKTTWVFAQDGNLSLTIPGEYTVIVNNTVSKTTKMWGSGGAPNTGGNSAWGQGGAGGAANGTVTFVSGQTYKIRVPQYGVTGTAAATTYGAGNGGGIFSVGSAGSGGGYAGIFLSSVSQGNAVLMAGGGGGGASDRSDGLGGRPGAGGGGTTGEVPGGLISGSGSQSSGGSSGGGGSPTSGSALQGGNGSGGGAGGGGGYYGGGGGGTQTDGGYGGGGGSGYYNPTYVAGATLYTATATTPGNSADASRPSGAGAGATAGGTSGNGAIIIIA